MNVRAPLRYALLLSIVFAAVAGLANAPRIAASASSSDTLKVGDMAPDFTLPYATKDSIAMGTMTLSSMYGKGPIVLAFYPADWSGGCTKEVCSFRDNFSSLSALNAQVLGISGDYVFSHHEWAKFHNLPFTLASDHDHAIAKKYSSYNEKYGVDNRTVYALDKTGKIVYIDLKYSPRDDASLKKLQAALEGIHS
jgi:peroxiredoxin Q/BCP